MISDNGYHNYTETVQLFVTLNLDGGPASPHQYLERDTRMGQIITDTYMVWEYETNLKSARVFA